MTPPPEIHIPPERLVKAWSRMKPNCSGNSATCGKKGVAIVLLPSDTWNILCLEHADEYAPEAPQFGLENNR